jgi:hypothetical protein
MKYDYKVEGGYIKVKPEDYYELLRDVKFLDCLCGMGVDNWEGYEAAVEEYESTMPGGY